MTWSVCQVIVAVHEGATIGPAQPNQFLTIEFWKHADLWGVDESSDEKHSAAAD
jgi:hypothetical protein